MGITRNSRADEIIEYISEQFLQVRWKPGMRIDDNELAVELGVSRNSVREALEKLVAVNAVEKRQWIGFFVPVIDLNYAVETLSIRKDLETLALKLFLEKPVSPELIKQIDLGIAKSEFDMNNGDWSAFLVSDYVIHKVIQNNCGNRWISVFLSQTGYAVSQIQYLDREGDVIQYAKRSISEHRELLKLIKDRKKDEAVEKLGNHLSIQIDRIKNLLK